MKTKQKIINNTFITGGTNFLTAVIGFFLLPYMILKLGSVQYGLLALTNIFTVYGMIGMLDLGVQQTVTKYVAEYNSINDKDSINQIFSTSLIVLVFIALLVSGFAILFLDHISQIFNIELEHIEVFSMALLIVFISCVLQFPNLIFLGFFEGLQRYSLSRGVTFAFFVLSSILTVIILEFFSTNYLIIVIKNMIIYFLQFCVSIYIAFKIFPGLKVRLKLFSIRKLQKIANFAKYLVLSKVAAIVYHQSDKFFIGVFLEPKFITLYEILVKLPRFLKVIFSFISAAVFPAASEMQVLNKKDSLSKLFSVGFNILTGFTFPIIIMLMFFSGDFLEIWVGSEYLNLAKLLSLLLIWNLFSPTYAFGWSMLTGMKQKLKELSILSWLNTIIKVTIVLLFIREFKLYVFVLAPIVGIIVTLAWSLRYFSKYFEKSYCSFLANFIKVSIISMLPCLVFYFVKEMIPNNFVLLLIKCVIWCFISWLMLFYFVIDTDTKEVVKSVFKKMSLQIRNAINTNFSL